MRYAPGMPTGSGNVAALFISASSLALTVGHFSLEGNTFRSAPNAAATPAAWPVAAAVPVTR